MRNRDGTERMLLDVTVLDPGGLTTLDGWTPSREGDRPAYLLSTGGDEESRLYVMDITSGETLEGPMAGEQQFHPPVWRHRVGTTLYLFTTHGAPRWRSRCWWTSWPSSRRPPDQT